MGLLPDHPGRLSVPALAREVGMSPQRLYALIAKGRGPALTPFGKEHLVRVQDAIKWIEDRLMSPWVFGNTAKTETYIAKHQEALQALKVRQVAHAIRFGEPLPPLTIPQGTRATPSVVQATINRKVGAMHWKRVRNLQEQKGKYTPKVDGLVA